MPIRVKSVENLRAYFQGVVNRADHHAPNVNHVIYPLLGFITLHMDDDSDIEVRSNQDAMGNILWVWINQKKYAFRYEHSDGHIEIHKETHSGPLVTRISNSSSIQELRTIFENLN